MTHLPITPPEGVGVVYPSCDDRSSRIVMPIRAGIGLRIGGEAALCFTCGPDGSVYHPASGTVADGASADYAYSMADIEALWPRLAMTQDPTAADLATFDTWMRDRYGSGPAGKD